VTKRTAIRFTLSIFTESVLFSGTQRYDLYRYYISTATTVMPITPFVNIS